MPCIRPCFLSAKLFFFLSFLFNLKVGKFDDLKAGKFERHANLRACKYETTCVIQYQSIHARQYNTVSERLTAIGLVSFILAERALFVLPYLKNSHHGFKGRTALVFGGSVRSAGRWDRRLRREIEFGPRQRSRRRQRRRRRRSRTVKKGHLHLHGTNWFWGGTFLFLDATAHLYMRSCPSVGP